jgi:hypothetical protein
MSRPTVTVVSAKGEATKDTVTVPNVFKVSSPPQCRTREPQQTILLERVRESYNDRRSDTHTWEDLKENGKIGMGEAGNCL